MHGVFISYGRRDDEPFVERLYADLARSAFCRRQNNFPSRPAISRSTWLHT